MMKRHFFLLLIGCLFAVNASAQMRDRVVGSRTFDNFDTTAGVRVYSANAAPAPATMSKAKNPVKTVKKTALVTANVGDGMGLQNATGKLHMATGHSLGGFTTGDTLIDSYITDSSARYAIDPLLIYSQMHQESSFNTRAVSYKGASGLMQLMPATARRFGVTNIFDKKQNIEAGVKYMRWLLDTFGGDVNLALAGYNAGEGAVMKYGYRVPPYNETREYVRRITARYNSIRNPNTLARTIKKVSTTEAAKLEQKTAAPLTIFEPVIITVKTPDGRLRLVNQ